MKYLFAAVSGIFAAYVLFYFTKDSEVSVATYGAVVAFLASIDSIINQ